MNKVVFNTGITYLKSIITIFILLYTTRLVLVALGAKDFGLFNVVGGVVTMLAFLNSAMTTSTQRYLSYNLGSGDFLKLNKIFANSVILHFVIAVFLVLVFEIVGYYLVNYKLVISQDRLYAANLLLQFVIISTFFTIIGVPYDAIINAYENMLFLALVGIFEVVLKLFVAIYITYSVNDKLIEYGFLMMSISILLRIVKQVYVKFKYSKIKLGLVEFYEKKIIKELSFYAGWNMFGALSIVGKNEALAILFNLFFGTVVNAAFAVANQVSAQVLFFSRTLMQAINPQIVKNEGSGDRKKMIQFAFSGCKYSFMLVCFIAVPCMFEMKSILSFWLKDVPEYSVIFCQLIVLSLLFNQITIGLQTAIQATGKIKKYQAIVGSIQLLNIPFFYVLFKIGFPPYSAMISFCFFEIVSCCFRLIILKELTNVSITFFLEKVVVSQIIPFISAVFVCAFITTFLEFNFRFIATIFITSIVYFVTAYFFSLSDFERKSIKTYWSKILFSIGFFSNSNL